MADISKFRLGELFSGPGGLALGAHFAAEELGLELQHAWANDIDPNAVRTYLANIPGARDSTVIPGDVRELDIRNLAPIDGLAFGFPCNDFSSVGEQKGINGRYGPLYSYGVEALNLHNPMWFFAENVGGIRSSNEGKAFSQIIRDLTMAGQFGYSIVPHLYKFENYGVPQARHRVVLIGIRRDLGLEFLPPSPEPYRNLNNSVRHSLTNPPIPSDAKNHELTKQSKIVVERLKHIAPGKNAFNSDIPKNLQLNVRGAKISQIYRRLDPEKPSYTVTGSGGGGTHVYHWIENRALTNRERARLQTFPDDFVFLGSKENVRKQIGMAVPVLGAKAIFLALFQTFMGVEYESVQPNLPNYLDTSALWGPGFDIA
jgi:DNA (cytosine-5)-methyltransferase 1